MNLQKIKIATLLKVSQEFAENLKLEVGYTNEDFILDQLTYNLTGFLWGEDLGEYIVKYPKDWWHSLQDRFLPNWFKKYVAIEYIVIRVNQKVIYPELNSPSFIEQRKLYSNTILEQKEIR